MRERNIVEGLIVNENNELLLQKKTIDYPTLPGGYWCFFGGEIENGEKPDETIRRELREELGIDFQEIHLYRELDYEIPKYYGKQYVFEVKFKGKISDIRLTEGAGFAFFDKSELKNLKIPEMEKRVLRDYFGV